MRAALALLLALGLAPALHAEAKGPDPRVVVGPPAGPSRSGNDLEQRARNVGALLRCPVCQGLSVQDSPATMAQDMRAEVRALVAQGYSDEQVLTYFEHSYGEFVRLKPPLRGINWLVWLAPVLVLASGALIVSRVIARPGPAAEAPGVDVPDPDALPDDARLVPYVLKVRELAYGWPGGKRP